MNTLENVQMSFMICIAGYHTSKVAKVVAKPNIFLICMTYSLFLG